MLSKNCLKDYLLDLHEVLESLDLNQVVKIAEILFTAAKSGKRVYVFGNGDSATNSLHLAADLSKTSSLEGLSLKIYSLVNNVPLITAWANDSSYESIFVEQLKNFLEEGDVVIGFSGSGNSKNVLEAIKYANSKHAITVGLTAFNGGKLKDLANYVIVGKTNSMEIAEDLHWVIGHLLKVYLIELIRKQGSK
ncbi:MAG TPA: SIS domain-containing protein [Candidatus Bilamarchaeaceae archaeon]|nr:SIS domain-containing protein [Candidatus Bilamarchaeaceae archaeon]